jgi:exo-beta-1,3-glucanase (GH17 family)
MSSSIGQSLIALAREDVEIRDSDIYVGGERIVVKGIHYSPWLPNTGPGKSSWPNRSVVEADLKLIKELNVNTIMVYDPPDYFIELAEENGFMVGYVFWIDWSKLNDTQYEQELKENIENAVLKHKNDTILFWALGNEIQPYLIDEYGATAFESFIRDLYLHAKSLDGTPITHLNWPPNKDLNLSFLDIISFNLYPYWPPEVVAMGYGNYLRQVLKPIAGNKPSLITEFGMSSLLAGEDKQAEFIREAWNEIKQSGAAGGIVFEFRDEWWKNYDNPIKPGDWWHRVPDPDDEKKHDEDPEEFMGLVDSSNEPRRAFYTVKEMFSESSPSFITTHWALFLAILVLIPTVVLAFKFYKGFRKSSKNSRLPKQR